MSTRGEVLVFAAKCGPADEHDPHRDLARVAKRVDGVARYEDRVARRDRDRLAADRHLARALEDVVDLLGLAVVVRPYGAPGREQFLGEAALRDVGRGPVDERPDLGPVGRPENVCGSQIYDLHLGAVLYLLPDF